MSNTKILAIIKDTKVINVIVINDTWTGKIGEWQPPEGTIAVPLADQCGIGDTYDGVSFIRQPQEPQLTIEELRLRALDKLNEQKLQTAMLDPDAPQEIKEYAAKLGAIK